MPLPISGTEPRFDNFVVANFRFYPLSYTPAKVEILAVSVFPNNTTARYAHCGHRVSNLTMFTRRCNRLSYAAANNLVLNFGQSEEKHLTSKMFQHFIIYT